jgi:hypothetical protein
MLKTLNRAREPKNLRNAYCYEAEHQSLLSEVESKDKGRLNSDSDRASPGRLRVGVPQGIPARWPG